MGDREAVRTPMQWSNRPAGGFSTADPDDLPRKVLRDGPFGYRKVNVQDQRRDEGSLLNWMERLIRTRKEWPAIGWGTCEVLGTRNPSVLALVFQWDGTSVLAIHNFSGRRRTDVRDAAVRLTLVRCARGRLMAPSGQPLRSLSDGRAWSKGAREAPR